MKIRQCVDCGTDIIIKPRGGKKRRCEECQKKRDAIAHLSCRSRVELILGEPVTGLWRSIFEYMSTLKDNEDRKDRKPLESRYLLCLDGHKRV